MTDENLPARDKKLDCDSLPNAGPVCLKSLDELVDSSWRHLQDEVGKRLVHWHCTKTKTFWARCIAKQYSVEIKEFHADAFLRLDDVLREPAEGRKFLKAATLKDLEFQCRRCIYLSHKRVRDKYYREVKKGPEQLESPEHVVDSDDPDPDIWYTRQEITECLDCMTDLERFLLTEICMEQRPQVDVAAEIGRHPGTVSKNLYRAEQKLWQCLKKKGILP